MTHTIFYGPVGTGKSYTARAVAQRMGKPGTKALAREMGAQGVAEWLLDKRRAGGETLLLDEIHGLGREAQEILCSALDSPAVKVAGRVFRALPFTLLGTTHRAVSDSLAHRCELVEVPRWTLARLVELAVANGLTADAAGELARRSRGTPRDLLRLLPYVQSCRSAADTGAALDSIGVFNGGLTDADRRILEALRQDSRVGLTRLAHYSGMAEDAVEQAEAFLVWAGFIGKDLRGRYLRGAT